MWLWSQTYLWTVLTEPYLCAGSGGTTSWIEDTAHTCVPGEYRTTWGRFTWFNLSYFCLSNWWPRLEDKWRPSSSRPPPPSHVLPPPPPITTISIFQCNVDSGLNLGRLRQMSNLEVLQLMMKEVSNKTTNLETRASNSFHSNIGFQSPFYFMLVSISYWSPFYSTL